MYHLTLITKDIRKVIIELIKCSPSIKIHSFKGKGLIITGTVSELFTVLMRTNYAWQDYPEEV